VRAVGLLLLSAAFAWAEVSPGELVRQSIANGEKAWKLSHQYEFRETDTEERLDASGEVKSRSTSVLDVFPVGGTSYEKLVQKNGRPLTPEQSEKEEQRLLKTRNERQRETPTQRAARLAKEERDRSFMKEVPDAFDFKIVGQEHLPTGDAWVLEAAPRPGFQPRSRYAKTFPKMRGKLWIDKKDVQWVKADAEAMDTVSFWFFLARLAKGSHIVLEQARLPDGNWVPKSLRAQASARVMLVKSYRFRENITYGDYRKVPRDTGLSAAKRER
jgi:hypothetical protein